MQIDIDHAMMDDEFKKILANDPVLDDLEKEKYNPKDEFFALMHVLSSVYKICGINCCYITPAIWSYLWSIGNAFTLAGTKEITEVDIDIFMYILSKNITEIDEDFVVKSARFCELHGINYIEARLDLMEMIHIAFRPLEMIPRDGNIGNAEDVQFDADWLTYLVSIACQMSNRNSRDIMYNMSLTECFYYLVQYRRKNETIKKRNSAEIDKAIYERYYELGKEYWEKNYKED